MIGNIIVGTIIIVILATSSYVMYKDSRKGHRCYGCGYCRSNKPRIIEINDPEKK